MVDKIPTSSNRTVRDMFKRTLKALEDVIPPRVYEKFQIIIFENIGEPCADKLVELLEPFRADIEKKLESNGGGTLEAFAITAETVYNELRKMVEEAKEKTKPPFRVKVWNGDQSKYLGEGIYEGDVKAYFVHLPDGSLNSLSNAEEKPDMTQFPPGSEMIESDNNPRIVLDSGKVVYGCQVWWDRIPS